MVNNTFTVTGLIAYLKKLVDSDFNIQSIYLKGEISKVTVSPAGHCYFELKDANTSVSCVSFKNSYLKSKEHIKTGNKVVLFGGATIYAATSKLQFNVLECVTEGIGDLYRQFEELKKDLAKRGLFDQNHKIKCPEYPEKIAVIVGKDSAAYTDIVATFKRRWPYAKVDYYFSLVQGKDAHLNIIQNLIKVDELGYDAIILARGGGSIEDLWCFNEPSLAEVIYDLNTFIVTGVGHEIDTTIVDYVSDLRANTPTAAVELITPDIFDLINDLENISDYLLKIMHDSINSRKQMLLKYSNVFSSIDLVINRNRENIEKALYKINSILISSIYKKQSRLDVIDKQLDSAFKFKYKNSEHEYEISSKRLINAIKEKLERFNKSINRMDILLDAFSPLNVLDRGFVIASSNGQIIKRIDKIKVKDVLNLKFKDGFITAEVKEISNAKDEF